MNDQDALKKAYPSLMAFWENETGRWLEIAFEAERLEAENERLQERVDELEGRLAAALGQLALRQVVDHD